MTPLAPLAQLSGDLPDVVILLGLFWATALVFLFAGWRLGLESAGRTMPRHPLSGVSREEADAAGGDPWEEAMYGPTLPHPASADSRAEGRGTVCASRDRPARSGGGDVLPEDG